MSYAARRSKRSAVKLHDNVKTRRSDTMVAILFFVFILIAGGLLWKLKLF